MKKIFDNEIQTTEILARMRVANVDLTVTLTLQDISTLKKTIVISLIYEDTATSNNLFCLQLLWLFDQLIL